MERFLFQGDSITDAGRQYENDKYFGQGYATVVASVLGTTYPNEIEFINRGINGNRIVDVYARIKADIINLNPDYMSILIGVNDVWHEIGEQNGVDVPKFEKIYSMLIEELQEALPKLKIIIMAPFVTEGVSTINEIDRFRTGVKERTEAAGRVANKYGLDFITLQDKFDLVIEKAPSSYWTTDGVHPTPAGHGIIAKALIEKFKEIKL